jgi:hypothetical protein
MPPRRRRRTAGQRTASDDGVVLVDLLGSMRALGGGARCRTALTNW